MSVNPPLFQDESDPHAALSPSQREHLGRLLEAVDALPPEATMKEALFKVVEAQFYLNLHTINGIDQRVIARTELLRGEMQAVTGTIDRGLSLQAGISEQTLDQLDRLAARLGAHDDEGPSVAEQLRSLRNQNDQQMWLVFFAIVLALLAFIGALAFNLWGSAVSVMLGAALAAARGLMQARGL